MFPRLFRVSGGLLRFHFRDCRRSLLVHNLRPLWPAIYALCLLGLTVGIVDAAASDEVRRVFDLPADAADRSLQRLSLQSGLQVVFAASVTEGVKANPVKGEFTPIEAARELFAGTPLRVTYNDKTGVLSVTRGVGTETPAVKKKRPMKHDEQLPNLPRDPTPPFKKIT